MESKFFRLVSKANGQVLRIGDACEGAQVYVGDSRPDLNELWYQDKINNVIRTRRDETLCLTVASDKVVVSHFHTAEENQLWKISGDRIVHTDEERRGDRGQLTIVSDGVDHRTWDAKHADPIFFFMETCMVNEKKPGEHLVVEVYKGDDDPGAKIQLAPKNIDPGNEPAQLWWEDRYGYIRTKINDFVLDTKKDQFIVNPYADNVATQQWVKAGLVIVNRNNPSEAMDVKGEKNKKGATMCSYNYKGSTNQHWFFRYL